MKNIIKHLACLFGLVFIHLQMTYGQQSWNISGNAGLIGNPAIFGTIDSADINIITKNQVRMSVSSTGNIGIGGVATAAKLQMDNGSLLLNGNIGVVNFSGAGTRLMWVPAKAAFRAGGVSGTQWDKDSIGSYSTAFGYSTKATAYASTAFGYGCQAAGGYSTAFGINTIASGRYSTTFGVSTKATGDNSLASGVSTVAAGLYSTATGAYTIANGNFSSSWGISTKSQAAGVVAIGRFNVGKGDSVNWVVTDPVFEIGIGTNAVRSNALTVLKNGNVGIGTSTPSYALELKTNSAAKPGSGTWLVASDKRLKNKITPFGDGLNIIEKMKPVFFHYNGKEDLPESEEFVGIIAQDMKEIAPYMIKPYDIIDQENKEKRSYLAYDPNALFYILVNAVKELSADNKQLNITLMALNNELNELRKWSSGPGYQIQKTTQDSNSTENNTVIKNTSLDNAYIISAINNPGLENIILSLFIPARILEAKIIISSFSGLNVQTIQVTERDFFKKQLLTANLASGNYLCTLLADGKHADSKMVILVK